MPERLNSAPDVACSPSELLKLPRAERNAILSRAAAEAEDEYRTNHDLTDFEAFGEDDLYGESQDSEAR
jgi:hypothetical protein